MDRGTCIASKDELILRERSLAEVVACRLVGDGLTTRGSGGGGVVLGEASLARGHAVVRRNDCKGEVGHTRSGECGIGRGDTCQRAEGVVRHGGVGRKRELQGVGGRGVRCGDQNIGAGGIADMVTEGDVRRGERG